MRVGAGPCAPSAPGSRSISSTRQMHRYHPPRSRAGVVARRARVLRRSGRPEGRNVVGRSPVTSSGTAYAPVRPRGSRRGLRPGEASPAYTRRESLQWNPSPTGRRPRRSATRRFGVLPTWNSRGSSVCPAVAPSVLEVDEKAAEVLWCVHLRKAEPRVCGRSRADGRHAGPRRRVGHHRSSRPPDSRPLGHATGLGNR